MTTRAASTSRTDARGGWRHRLWLGWSLFRGVVGADAYDVYLEHQRRTHPGEPVMGRKEFWRDRTDRQERNPTTRCC